jgi:predicted hydrocarbon binding protein
VAFLQAGRSGSRYLYFSQNYMKIPDFQEREMKKVFGGVLRRENGARVK